MPEFVHLHLHTEYSLLDGACRIGELLDEAERLKMPALAVTEHGNLFSAIVFHDQARQRGIKPILGCEVYVAPGSRLTKGGPTGIVEPPHPAGRDQRGVSEPREADLLGLHRGVLLQAAHRQGAAGRAQQGPDRAQQLPEGRGRRARCGPTRPSAPPTAAATYRDILGAGNFFLELQYQGIEEQRIVNDGLLPLSRDLGMPLVCTNDVHYLRRDDFRPHDILLCIGTGRTVNDAERMRYHGDQFYLKTPEEMAAVFGHLPEALRNTVAIAERCNVDLSDTGPTSRTSRCPTGSRSKATSSTSCREGFDDAAAAPAELRRAGPPAPFDRASTGRASSTRSTSSSGCSTRATS